MKVQVVVDGLFVGILCFVAFNIFNSTAVKVYNQGELTCSSVCGIMFAASDKATEEDFSKLLDLTYKKCSEEPGTATSYRTEEGELKHVVVVGDEDIISKPGTEFNTCVINWELTRDAAMQAFKDVCINRKFK